MGGNTFKHSVWCAIFGPVCWTLTVLDAEENIVGLLNKEIILDEPTFFLIFCVTLVLYMEHK